jgi:hypothetical protein
MKQQTLMFGSVVHSTIQKELKIHSKRIYFWTKHLSVCSSSCAVKEKHMVGKESTLTL